MGSSSTPLDTTPLGSPLNLIKVNWGELRGGSIEGTTGTHGFKGIPSFGSVDPRPEIQSLGWRSSLKREMKGTHQGAGMRRGPKCDLGSRA